MARTQTSPSQIADALTSTDFATASVDGASNVACLRTLGTGSAQAAAGNHTHAVTLWQALTDGATVTLAWLHASTNAVTLGGNRTLALSGTPAQGESCYLRLKQDGTGGRTLTWPTSGVTFNWPADEEIILGTTASRTDVVKLTCVDATPSALIFDAQIEFMNSY